MMHLMLTNASPNDCFEDHLEYGDYVGKFSAEFVKRKAYTQGKLPESSYEFALTLESLGLNIMVYESSTHPTLHYEIRPTQTSLRISPNGTLFSVGSVAAPAKDCLKMAKRLGHTPSLNCANLAISLSRFTLYRAELEWYKTSCDEAEDKLGYYDSFKLYRFR